MTTPEQPVRGVTDSIISSGFVRAFGLDAVGALAVALIGVSVYRLSPNLVWAYAGVLLLIAWWSVGQARAKAAKEPRP